MIAFKMKQPQKLLVPQRIPKVPEILSNIKQVNLKPTYFFFLQKKTSHQLVWLSLLFKLGILNSLCNQITCHPIPSQGNQTAVQNLPQFKFLILATNFGIIPVLTTMKLTKKLQTSSNQPRAKKNHNINIDFDNRKLSN